MPFTVGSTAGASGDTVDLLYVTEGYSVAHTIVWATPSFIFSKATLECDAPNSGITMVGAATSTISGSYVDEFPIQSITWTKPQEVDTDGNPMSIESVSLPGSTDAGAVIPAEWSNVPTAGVGELQEFLPSNVTHVLHTYTLTVDSVHSVSGAPASETLTLLETSMMDFEAHATEVKRYV